jgi:prepilin-type N-terminal cleavage/methylation domain-containing protein
MHNIQNLRIAAVQIQRNQKSSQSVSKSAGLTLLESMIALSIFAVVIWAAMANYTSANATQAASQMATELQSLRNSVKDLNSGQGGVFGNIDGDDMNEAIIGAQRVPSTLNISGTTIKTVNGGEVKIMGYVSDYTIEYSGIGKALCVSALTGPGANGWLDIKANAATAAAKYTPSAADEACKASGNAIVFRGA